MRIDTLRRLRGPNRLSPEPVLTAVVELEELTGERPLEVPGFLQRLAGFLEGLPPHSSGSGTFRPDAGTFRPDAGTFRPDAGTFRPDAGTFRPDAGTLVPGQRANDDVSAHRREDDCLPAARSASFEKVAEHVLFELCCRIGRDATLVRAQPADDRGRFQLTLGCPPDEWVEDPTAEDLLQLTLDIIQAASSSDAAPEGAFAAELARVRGVFEEGRLGVSTAELARAARQRGIPVRRLSEATLLQLGTGCHRRLLWAATTDITSSIGVDIASDKDLTHLLLEAAGIPVPQARVVRTADEARAAYSRLGPPVVVKPLFGHHGLDVFVELRTLAHTLEAYQALGPEGTSVLIERYIPGRDYRVLVVDGRMRAAAELTPARVTGDGKATVAQLVEAVNRDPRRGDGHDRPLTKIVLDDMSRAHLSAQGYSPDWVLERGQTVQLRRNANLSTGGTSRDVTDLVHPDIARACVRTAAVMSLDVCGIDLRAADITAPMRPGHTDAAVIEVNASPGLRMHLYPSEGRSRDVAADIINHVFPPGAPSRVPLVSVTGTNGKTTTVRLVAAIMGGAGSTVGLASTEGVYVDNQLVFESDASGPRSAEMVLGNPAVEVAVLETARGGIARRGLGYDWADVAIVTNIGRDHIGSDGVRDLADLVEVKALVAERIRRGGTLVLNADDPHTVGLAARAAVVQTSPDVRLFSLEADSPLVRQHLDRGGAAYVLDREGWLVETEHDARRRIIRANEMPVAFGGLAPFNIANALAATAASRALGVDMRDVRRALASFDPDRDNPGRGNLLRVEGVPVVVDYAHNADALTAVAGLVTARWGTDAVAVITLPGDRPDALVLESARAVGKAFRRVVVYEDLDLRGRRPGDMTALIRSGVFEARPNADVLAAGSLDEAAGMALALAVPADPVLIVYEHLDPLMTLLRRLQAAEPVANAVR